MQHLQDVFERYAQGPLTALQGAACIWNRAATYKPGSATLSGFFVCDHLALARLLY
ncbi:hypothetical protein [Pseudomonas chlororaphis]|uniref:hypothetical protein n=1 Tax=Pseudomonas chlororaphis TaxID=587753 RepID=UPI000F711E41|nr:hypothetical protein C4K16_2139 [Pseudomonas chlororaphis subsp. aurantiaca]